MHLSALLLRRALEFAGEQRPCHPIEDDLPLGRVHRGYQGVFHGGV